MYDATFRTSLQSKTGLVRPQQTLKEHSKSLELGPFTPLRHRYELDLFSLGPPGTVTVERA